MAAAVYDIVPVTEGWAVVHEGLHCGSYPSHGLAAEAARNHCRQRKSRSFILRQQDLTGRMRESGAAWQGWAAAPRAETAI